MTECVTEVAGADDEQTPFAVEAEDLSDILTELAHVVADAANAELPEVREIFPNLSGVEVEPLRQLLTGNGFDAEIEELVDASQVDRQT